MFYGETDVETPALFRYTTDGGEKIYLETPEGYIDASNRIRVWSGGVVGDNSAEREKLNVWMEFISGIR